MGAAAFLILLLFFLLAFQSSAQIHHYRRILHQPFFPVVESLPPTPTIQPPFPSPQPQPQPQRHQPIKYPFSSQTTPPSSQHDHFFPLYPSPPSPPSSPHTPTTSLPTYPANISSITIPHPASSKPVPRKLVAIAVAVSLLSVALISAVAASLLYHRKRQSDNGDDAKGQRSDSLRLFPPNTATSDKPPPPTPPVLPPRSVSSTSSEFLYLGTLVSSRGADDVIEIRRKSGNLSNVVGGSTSNNNNTTTTTGYQRLGSPELHPLPPLPRHNFQREYRDADDDEEEEDNGELFFSPRGSSDAVKVTTPNVANNFSSGSGVFRAAQNSPTNPSSSSSSSPTRTMSSSPSPVLNLSPRSLRSRSPDSVVDFPVQLPQERRTSPGRVSIKLPPPPPPFPPPRFWESAVFPPQSAQDPAVTTGPPVLAPPTNGRESFEGGEQKNEEILKPKLKPLHWDKVRASSDRAMVWDQLKFSSFQLNEEMIETLFMVNSSNLMPKDNKNPHAVIPNTNQENRVLDPKKSQNIAILLRALNVTVDEVCEGLLEGNVDTLGTELLESLLKMSPTNEEEHKLKEFNDTSPFKLGPAEKFLKAVIDIPFAFKRVDAMLYISNFDSEVEYLKRSFETLEAACEELRKSRMFLKLLEAVLKTGNRMNVGTNRGDAHAFKLDTLLKLVDVKGTDGKTTLLHFVVQEIIRAEGSRLSGADQDPIAQKPSDFRDDVEFRKLGLEVVSSLSGELSNVKKAAAMDSDVLISEAGRLAMGISKIREVLRLNEQLGGLTNSSRKFSESLTVFLKRAEEDITKIQAQERVALSMVKEITEYFHGNSAKEEAHPLRIFLVVRDFLSILDQVCKEVGKINERTTVSSARQFPLPLNQSEPSIFPRFGGKQHYSSSDDETSSSF